jgi:hypothetical protein
MAQENSELINMRLQLQQLQQAAERRDNQVAALVQEVQLLRQPVQPSVQQRTKRKTTGETSDQNCYLLMESHH